MASNTVRETPFGVRVLLSHYSDQLTYRQLQKMKLPDLVQYVPESNQNRWEYEVFFNWLEGQRIDINNDPSYPWYSTIDQVVYALKQRSFSLRLLEVFHREITDENAPQSLLPVQGRPPLRIMSIQIGWQKALERDNQLENLTRYLHRQIPLQMHVTRPQPPLQPRTVTKKAAINPDLGRDTLGRQIYEVNRCYTCKRCHVKGHHEYNCPTNLNPTLDPVQKHPCKSCGSFQHWYDLCPINPYKGSLYNIRVRHSVIALAQSNKGQHSEEPASAAETGTLLDNSLGVELAIKQEEGEEEEEEEEEVEVAEEEEPAREPERKTPRSEEPASVADDGAPLGNSLSVVSAIKVEEVEEAEEAKEGEPAPKRQRIQAPAEEPVSQPAPAPAPTPTPTPAQSLTIKPILAIDPVTGALKLRVEIGGVVYLYEVPWVDGVAQFQTGRSVEFSGVDD